MIMIVSEDLRDRHDMLLLDYASGALDEALSLIVASWLTLSPEARAIVARYETVGAHLMCQNCTPERMAEGSLKKVLDRLGARQPVAVTKAATQATGDPCVPWPLRSYMSGCPSGWQRAGEGARILDLSLVRPGRASVLALEPGRSAPRGAGAGVEMTLVLKGAYSDGEGFYRSGQLAIHDAGFARRYTADRAEGCLTLVISDAVFASRLKGWRSVLRRWLGQ
jgi:putative transcriptional regulator